jgi:acyl carrier protein
VGDVDNAEGTGWQERGVREWLVGGLAARLGLVAEDAGVGADASFQPHGVGPDAPIEPHGVGPDTSFEQCGLDAVGALALAVDAGSACGVLLEPTAAWDHPTVGSLARHLAQERERSRAAHEAPAR